MTPANDNRPKWFDDLLLKYEPFMRSECAKRRTSLAAEDLYQESVMRAIGKWQRYRQGQEKGFMIWITYIIREVIQQHGKKNRHHLVQLTEEHEGRTQPVADNLVELAMVTRDLTPGERYAVIGDGVGLSDREMATMCGVTTSRVSFELSRAREKMRAANDNVAAGNRDSAHRVGALAPHKRT
jgi:RNA polymerase sigma factor (sigma-70 family)